MSDTSENTFPSSVVKLHSETMAQIHSLSGEKIESCFRMDLAIENARKGHEERLADILKRQLDVLPKDFLEVVEKYLNDKMFFNNTVHEITSYAVFATSLTGKRTQVHCIKWDELYAKI